MTPLTVADTEINSLVIKRINEEYPEHSILGEEESDMKDNSTYTWVCDPVDGTMPYSRGLPLSTFSLALCEDGRPIVAVVYDPFMNRLFSATKGGGAYCNDLQMNVSGEALGNSLIAVEAFPSLKPVVHLGSEIRDVLWSKDARFVTTWSFILSAMLVAQGQFAGGILNLNLPHDGVTAKLIVEEAGGKVTSLFGNDQRYDRAVEGIIVSNGVIHEELVAIVKELVDKKGHGNE